MTTNKLQKLPIWQEFNPITGAIAALLLVLYAPLIWHWCLGWLTKSISIEHEYFSHAIIGIPFAAYITWVKRHKWQKIKTKTHPLGGILIGLAGAFYLSGLPDLVNLSFPVMLTGICWWLKGLAGLRLLRFPLLLIFLGTPSEVPYLIEPYILPLQAFIANIAGFILSLFGVNVSVQEIYLYVNNKVVEVAPHCAGLKGLFTSLYVSLILLYWTGAIASRRQVIFMLTGTLGLSVIANIIRNALLTYFHGTGNEGMFHWLHESWGGDLYSMVILGLLVPLLLLIEKLEADREENLAFAEGLEEEELNDHD